VVVPPGELSSVCTHESWAEIYAVLAESIRSSRSTLVFVNTRRLAERVAHALRAELGEDAVASHHGSLSKDIRLDAENRLRDGRLKAMVATASLELGIDIGFIDLVCQIGSPRSIGTFLQRVGRSGHSIGATPRGRLFPLSRDELIEAIALVRAVRAGRLDRIDIPRAPLDILAQQIVASVAADDWDESELFATFRQAAPYSELERDDFDAIVEILSEGIAPGKTRRGAYLHRDRIHGTLRARRSARISATCSGGAIPEMADYRVVTADDGTFVGTVNEDFAIESMAGDIFLLGNTSWRIQHVRSGQVVVVDAKGAPATVPFWLGEAPGRTKELSLEVSDLREELATMLEDSADAASVDLGALCQTSGLSEHGARQALAYVEAQIAAVGFVPTQRRIAFERFFDESGGMQLVVHAPFGARINRAWGLALRKRFCRSFNFELQASADDNGIVLSLGPQHSFPLEQMFHLVRRDHAESVLVQAVLAVPFFTTRWRWNCNRALAVLRQRAGKRVPPPLQRMQSDDLLSAVFPQSTACLEHVVGDIEVPDHPLVKQTLHDCLHEAMDIDSWLELLVQLENGEVAAVACDTREPSPFCYELLNASPYAFLDDAPLEERRARAVATRRSLDAEELRDLARLDPEVVAMVRAEAWPLVRDAEELHDALLTMAALREDDADPDWSEWLEELIANGRAARVDVGEGRLWIAAEGWPRVRAALPEAIASPEPSLPSCLRDDWEMHEARLELVRGQVECRPIETSRQISQRLSLPLSSVDAALEALEAQGIVLRGSWIDATTNGETQWCERRLLARIHRLTLEGLRRKIEPVSPEHFLRFLFRHTHLHPDHRLEHPEGLWALVDQLAGLEAPAGAWEKEILPLRVAEYDATWIDELIGSGRAAWARLRRPASATSTRGGSGRSSVTLTRAVPLTMFPREDLPWIARSGESPPTDGLSSTARATLDGLSSGGALFFKDLVRASCLLPSQVENGLSELAARGIVTADSFASIRPLVGDGHERSRYAMGARRRAADSRHARDGEGQEGPRLGSRSRRLDRGVRALASGPRSARWSLLEFGGDNATSDDRTQYWAWLLLRRYGVVFRDLLARESLAPRWGDLVRVYRRLEARGQIRGGRFVTGVGGEQYGLEESIALLRRVRDDDEEDWVFVSAADPVNLTGILPGDARVPSVGTNALAFRRGELVASRQGGEITFHREISLAERDEVLRKLTISGETRMRQEAQGHPNLPRIGVVDGN
jgi:ATP-dependent Lhr-like helicase